MRLIDADELITTILTNDLCGDDNVDKAILNAPTVKAIPIELYEQVKGERDVAIEQLKALNIELFEKPYLKAIPIEWINNWLSKGRNAKYFIPMMRMVEDWEKENDKGSE